MSARDATAELLRHRLHPVADAEHRNAQREDGGGRPFGAFLVRRQMTARQNDPARAERPYEIVPHVTRVDLAIHAAWRMRRAISCVYCAPKSRIRMRSCDNYSTR